jgi:hypothetical protein
LASNAIHERADLCKLQVQFGIRQRCSGGTYRRIRRDYSRIGLICLLFLIVELALRYGSGLRERGITLQIDLSEALLRLCLRKLSLRLLQLRLCLVNSRLKWTWINLKQNLTLSHRRTFTVILANQISTDVRLYLNVHKTIESTDPSARKRGVGLSDPHNIYGSGF